MTKLKESGAIESKLVTFWLNDPNGGADSSVTFGGTVTGSTKGKTVRLPLASPSEPLWTVNVDRVYYDGFNLPINTPAKATIATGIDKIYLNFKVF